ncbi:MAG TPA: acetate/propionate family kinase [Gaiellales bacterium]|nr:acetate/propionate family kinase [Gaiellales bacterium]
MDSLDHPPAGLAAVAHRVVHGGGRFQQPVVIDAEVETELAAVTELAPLHNTPALAAIRRARAALPDLPHVALFDSAFHATIPPEASTYALPAQVREDWGIRRFGFHGLSVQWASERVPAARLVVCHLGGGCSVTAVREGRSVDTTMGFTPLEGVPMATRPGSVDPGALLYLLRHRLTLDRLDRLLEHESGLTGLSGLSGDVAELERADGPTARLALAVFAYRVAAAVGAMAVALDGLDALVFTAGIGEHSGRVRADVCARLGFLGIELDSRANESARPDATISREGAPVRVVVVRAREDVVAARAARALIAQ